MALLKEGPPVSAPELTSIPEQRDKLGLTTKDLILRTLKSKLDVLPNYTEYRFNFVMSGRSGIVVECGGYNTGTCRWEPKIILNRTGIYEIPWKERRLDYRNRSEVKPERYLDLAEKALNEIAFQASQLRTLRQATLAQVR